jgi:hypothetical protein
MSQVIVQHTLIDQWFEHKPFRKDPRYLLMHLHHLSLDIDHVDQNPMQSIVHHAPISRRSPISTYQTTVLMNDQ